MLALRLSNSVTNTCSTAWIQVLFCWNGDGLKRTDGVGHYNFYAISIYVASKHTWFVCNWG